MGVIQVRDQGSSEYLRRCGQELQLTTPLPWFVVVS